MDIEEFTDLFLDIADDLCDWHPSEHYVKEKMRGRVRLLWDLVGMVEVDAETFSGKVLRELE